MPSYKILDVFPQDGQLVLYVEFHHADGRFWHTEHFVFQGREGSVRGREVDENNHLLMDNGVSAPFTTPVGGGLPRQFLPPDRSWKLRPGPYLTEEDVLAVITRTYQQRLANGWTRGTLNELRSFKSQLADELGLPDLVLRFSGMSGLEVSP